MEYQERIMEYKWGMKWCWYFRIWPASQHYYIAVNVGTLGQAEEHDIVAEQLDSQDC
jgi:hypothetical protein